MDEKTVKLTFCGDVMCQRWETDAVLRKHGKLDYGEYIGGTKTLLSRSDWVGGNLETPISLSYPLTSEAIRFNTDEKFLRALQDTGFSFFCTANNHCLDAGIRGLDETLIALERHGFGHDGTFKAESGADGIPVQTVGGLRLAVLSFTYGTNSEHNGEMLPVGEEWKVALLKQQNKRRRLPESPELGNGDFQTYVADDVSPAAVDNPESQVFLVRAAEKVRRAKGEVDFVVAMPHVGGQYNPGPGVYAKHVAKVLAEAGADMVVAGHPHVVQRCEPWTGGERFTVHSLGNFCCTPGRDFYVRNVLAEYGVVLHAHIGRESKKLRRVTFETVKSVMGEDGCTRVRPVADWYAEARTARERERLWMENEAVVNRFRGTCGEVVPGEEYAIPTGGRGIIGDNSV